MSINEYAFSFLKEAREASLVRELEIRRRQIEHLKEEGVLTESIPTGLRRLITISFGGHRSLRSVDEPSSVLAAPSFPSPATRTEI